jgi:two-component system, chemotaxis family, CheB/CheR fusion protein
MVRKRNIPSPLKKTARGKAAKTKSAKPSQKPENTVQKKSSKSRQPQNPSFPIVGIGASAGGLEALERFLSNMPNKTGTAFVIIQHLDPKHKSIMGLLLKKHTKLEILEVKNRMKIKPDCVYLNPPSKYVAIKNRSFCITDPIEPHGARLPIDYFFRSLSETRGEKSVGIILSGTGTDGTLGLKAIKSAGGMVMVQEEKEAKYDGMPRSAIDSGLVDFILPVGKMPKELMKYIQHPYIDEPLKTPTTREKFENYVQQILLLVRSKTGHDFSHYKQNTTRRRIERRMAVHQIESIKDYLLYLRKNASEAEALFKDMLITVTNFFRDPEAFEALQEKTIPALVSKKNIDSSLRIWVLGCATGEEAYSLAMILIEVMGKIGKKVDVQIFATDIDEEAIEFARAAVYPESIAADVSTERLERFFIKEKNIYKLKKQVREMVVFAIQNIIKDPPFSKLDLASCRNVLIYMDAMLQKKILPTLHYTLKEEGILFLGPSESIGGFTDLFSPIDSKAKIFKRIGPALENTRIPSRILHDEPSPAQFHAEKKLIDDADIQGIVEKTILERYAPSCVIIDRNHDILYFHGSTERYLAPPRGEPSFNIFDMAREEIRYQINTAVQKAFKQKKTVTCKDLQIKHNDAVQSFDLVARPLKESQGIQELILVAFEDRTPEDKKIKKKKYSDRQKEDPRIASLDRELRSTKESLQTTIEELETSNEELKSANEELQSTNEELQSTNEEMETSKEELQSTNEELVTVNTELERKLEELSTSNNDLNNLLASTEIATIFLDENLLVRRFTPAISKLFNLISSDAGRPISDITSKLAYQGLLKDAKEVLRTLHKKEIEIKTDEGLWFTMRIMPYRTVENAVDGLVITFGDITRLKQMEEAGRLSVVVRDSNDAVTLQDVKGKIVAWNRGAEQMYGYTEEEALKMNIRDIVPESERKRELNLVRKTFKEEKQKSFETQRISKKGKVMRVWFTATLLRDAQGKPFLMATTERDVTQQKQTEKEYKKTISELEKKLKKQ